MLIVSSGRDLSDWSRPLLGSLNNKVVATSFSLTGTSPGSASYFLSRPGFLMLIVSSGHDLSDWSRPPLGSLNNKVVATSFYLTGTSPGSASYFLSRPRSDVAICL